MFAIAAVVFFKVESGNSDSFVDLSLFQNKTYSRRNALQFPAQRRRRNTSGVAVSGSAGRWAIVHAIRTLDRRLSCRDPEHDSRRRETSPANGRAKADAAGHRHHSDAESC